MSDLINRQDAIDGADEIIKRDTSGNNAVVEAMKAWKAYIGNLPSAERKRGKWVEAYEDYRQQISWWECSVCKYGVSWKPNFCPNCGSEMRGEDDEC